MKNSFRQSMTWLHTWAGLLLGWVAYAIFVTGTASYFRPEITRWMQPEVAGHGTPIDAARLAARALEERAATAPRWFADLPDERTRRLLLLWQPAAGRFQNESLDPATGAKSTARPSMGGEFFYRFHFQLLLPHPWGRYTAGLVALALFVALLTGIVAHRRFFADLFLFRPGRIALRSWLDFHNVAGVLTLPFFLMISYSALVIFHNLYLPWSAKLLPPEKPAVTAQASPSSPTAWIAPAPLDPMIDEAARRWGTAHSIHRIEASDRGTARATVIFTRSELDSVSLRGRDQLKFDGVTGKLLDDRRLSATDGPGRSVHGIFYGLHLARFAGPLLRSLLFCLGLLGTALIASGLVMWTLKRRPKLATAGAGGRFAFWLVERLNVTAIAGLFVAIAALFWANRLLPVDLPSRLEREILCFLVAWAAMLVHACARRTPAAWREQLLLAAALFILLPGLDALTAGQHLAAAGRTFDLAYLGIETFFVVLGASLAIAAGKVARRVTSEGEAREGGARSASTLHANAADSAAPSSPQEVTS